ncbi:MAG TPA: MFS transporter, partial [Bryobacteraceae bacterium]|nr:MFS transporter [Bryobacteraceae bacterium]
ALAIASRTSVKGLGRVVGWASAGFGASLVLFSLSRWFWLSWFLLLPVGLCLMVQMACSNTLIQAMVPDHLRGRVMALYSVMFMGMAPFGALGAGAVAERLGAPWTVAIGGAACLAASLAYRSRLPAFRQEARQLIVAQGMAGGEPPAPGVPRS